MGRRSLISNIKINEFIKVQRNGEKERQPQYSLEKVDFNIVSRATHIEILQKQEYRTIERYVTQNYKKYPVYSAWKVKEKILKRTLKLTNLELESLNKNDDVLIKMFAEQIVSKLDNVELFPSWFVKINLKKKLDFDLQSLNKELKLFEEKQNNNIITLLSNIEVYEDNIRQYKKILKNRQKKKRRIEIKLTKLSNAKRNLLKSMITFGLYNFLISSKRKNKLELKFSTYNNIVIKLNKGIEDNGDRVNRCNKSIDNCKLSISEKAKECNNKKEMLLSDYNKNLLEVKPLSNTISQDTSFMMLKYFNGLEYEKIIGVYVIHNKEKDKYYVGQSKDIMKRIKQHFNGTIPRNTIFAEDYYTSQIENRENIFEIKIFKCETKDELDSLEKKLIYEYDSWNNGYNGTSGNN